MTDFDNLLAASPRPDLRPDDRFLEETLAAGLISPETARRILQTTSWKDFSFPAIRRFAQVVWPALQEGRAVDLLIFRKLLEKHSAADVDKTEARDLAERLFTAATNGGQPSTMLVDTYLTFFQEAADRRNLGQALRDAQDQLTDPFKTPADVLGNLTRLVHDSDPAGRLTGQVTSEGDGWKAYLAALQARQRSQDFQGLDTGFTHVNHVANGLMAGSLFVLGGTPSAGKTTFVKQLVDQVATKNITSACLFVSFEQSLDELRVKTLSRLSGIENRDLLRGRLNTETPGWKKVADAAEQYRKEAAHRVFILEADSTVTVDRIRSAAMQVIERTHCQQLLIAVDYLQIVPGSQPGLDPRSRVDAVISDLKRLARELQATVLAITSVGRSSYDASHIGAFKESGNIEYTADLAGILIEDKKNALTGADPFPHKGAQTHNWKRIYLDILKNRNGEKARINFDFYPAVSAYVQTASDPEPLPEEGGGAGQQAAPAKPTKRAKQAGPRP